MTDNSGTTADEQSNRIGALAALDRAEQSTVNTADGQTLLLMGLVLITAGSAKVAFAGRQRCSRRRNRMAARTTLGPPVASCRMESFHAHHRKYGMLTLSGLLAHRLLAWRLPCTECVC